MGIFNGQYREYKLDNGLVVALQNTPTRTTMGKLRINFGSSHEMVGEEGMAHLLEHCLISGGSEKYDPLTSDEIRGLFGSFAAGSSIGRIFFEGERLAEDLKIWLDYMSDHILRPRLDQERVDQEREIVLREISDAKSNPSYLPNQELDAKLYRGHPKEKSSFGKEEEEVVKNADVKKVRDFHSRGFHPNNMDLILVGRLPENVKELVHQYFGTMPRGENTRREFPALKPLQGREIIHRFAPERRNEDYPEESSAQLVLLSTCPAEGHPDEYALMTMAQILGAGSNSFLFQNMRLRKGLAYHVSTTYVGDYNCGVIHSGAKVPVGRIDEAIDTLFEEMERMKTQKVPDKTLDRIKGKVEFRIAKSLDSVSGLVPNIELKLDEDLTPEALMEGYNAVTPERILEVANQYLPDRDNGNYILYIGDPLKK